MSLVPRSQFMGDDGRAYLRTAGRGLVSRHSLDACSRYLRDRVADLDDENGIERAQRDCKARLGQLTGASAEDIALIGSTSEGINAIYALIDWRPGDNVVVCADEIEFPSTVLPALQRETEGLEVRVVRPQSWIITPQMIGDALDAKTRLVFVSHVSYRSGHRFDLEALAEVIRAASNAIFAVDASQSLGVIPVPAQACDFVVSTAVKWLLGVHGAAVLLWNRERVPDPQPPVVGWHSVVDDLERPVRIKPSAERFEPGNPPHLAAHVLNEGLKLILDIGVQRIEAHAVELGAYLLERLEPLGLAVTTPRPSALRAGIVCWEDPDCAATDASLRQRGVLVNGSANRVRASMHLYNEASDIDRLIDALQSLGE